MVNATDMAKTVEFPFDPASAAGGLAWRRAPMPEARTGARAVQSAVHRAVHRVVHRVVLAGAVFRPTGDVLPRATPAQGACVARDLTQ